MERLTAFITEYGLEIVSFTFDLLRLTVISLGRAIAFSLPLGILMTRSKKIAGPVLGIASVVQTIPSLTLFGLVILILMVFELPIIGMVPALFALFVYALLPILRNTYTGIQQVEPAILDAATSIGMTKRQIL